MRPLLIIPTYNEVKNIKELIERIDEQNLVNLNILFVDDNSPDGTADIIKNLQTDRDDIHLLSRKSKDGIGRAYIAGFRWGLENGYDLMIEMDADLSHDPKYLENMIEKSGEHDFVIGSRYVKGGGLKNWPWYRQMISRGGGLYARTILGCPIRDLTGGFNAWRREVLMTIGLDEIKSNGYAFQVEMKYRTWKKKYSFVEVPIVFIERRVGESKMSANIFVEAMWRVIQIKRIVG